MLIPLVSFGLLIQSKIESFLLLGHRKIRTKLNRVLMWTTLTWVINVLTRGLQTQYNGGNAGRVVTA